MAGVESVSAIAGIVSCTITLLHGCIKGFELLCRARKCEVQMSSLRLMLEFEEQKLLSWAREAGLFHRPPKLLVAVDNTRLVCDTLQHLSNLLCDVRGLRTYGLETEQTFEVMTDINEDSALSRLELDKKIEVRQAIEVTTKIFEARTTPWHRLKWVAVDEQRFRKLLSDISTLNHELQQLLERDLRRIIEQQHRALLRTAVMSTMSQQDLEILSQKASSLVVDRSIAASARLKKRTIIFGFFERIRTNRSASASQTEINGTKERPVLTLPIPQRSQTDVGIPPEQPEMKLMRRLLRLGNLPDTLEYRQIAYYDRKPVIVEWRPVTSNVWKLIQTRVSTLSSLLNTMDDPLFHSLSCRGFLRYEQAGVYGYVFDLPLSVVRQSDAAMLKSAPSTQLPPLPKVQTLNELLLRPTLELSLNVRVSCAIKLLETVLQLHTAGWLHKELRSDNILFIQAESSSEVRPDDVVENMYVGGYVYARADNSHEYTEPARCNFRSELYRHPSSLGSIRRPYRRSFDVFSVGCVMLELGLWRSLCDILKDLSVSNHLIDRPENTGAGLVATSAPSQDNRRHCEPSIKPVDDDGEFEQLKHVLIEAAKGKSGQAKSTFDRLRAQTGGAYTRTVMRCLAAAEDRDCTTSSASAEQEGALFLEQDAINCLKQLLDAL